MRYFEISCGIPIFIDNEEQNFINTHDKKFCHIDLSERDKVIAQTLVSKGIFNKNDDIPEKTWYVRNDNDHLWRIRPSEIDVIFKNKSF